MQYIFSSVRRLSVSPVRVSSGSCLVSFIGSSGSVHKVCCLKRGNKSERVLCFFNGKVLKLF